MKDLPCQNHPVHFLLQSQEHEECLMIKVTWGYVLVDREQSLLKVTQPLRFVLNLPVESRFADKILKFHQSEIVYVSLCYCMHMCCIYDFSVQHSEGIECLGI